MQRFEEVPNPGARLACGDEIEPRRIRTRGGRGDDLDLIAVFQFGAQGHELVIDARRSAMMSDVGVHAVGKIDRGCSSRQRHDLALGREDIDLLGEKVALDVLEKFLGIARLGLNLQQAFQPAMGLLLRLGDIKLSRLVEPMRRDARFGDAMHVVSAHLRLQRRPEGSEKCGVQRLVAVRLGDRDVILEFSGDRLVESVHDAERGVARTRVLHQDAHTVDIEDLRERVALFAHLLVHAVYGLLPARNRRADLLVLEALAYRLEDAIHHLASIAAR